MWFLWFGTWNCIVCVFSREKMANNVSTWEARLTDIQSMITHVMPHSFHLMPQGTNIGNALNFWRKKWMEMHRPQHSGWQSGKGLPRAVDPQWWWLGLSSWFPWVPSHAGTNRLVVQPTPIHWEPCWWHWQNSGPLGAGDGNMGHCFSTIKWLKISHCQPFWMRSHAGSPLGTSMACPFSGMQPCWMALKNAVVWEAESGTRKEQQIQRERLSLGWKKTKLLWGVPGNVLGQTQVPWSLLPPGWWPCWHWFAAPSWLRQCSTPWPCFPQATAFSFQWPASVGLWPTWPAMKSSAWLCCGDGTKPGMVSHQFGNEPAHVFGGQPPTGPQPGSLVSWIPARLWCQQHKLGQSPWQLQPWFPWKTL